MIIIKKFIIGMGVLGIFIIYSLGIRHQAPVIGKPSSLVASTKQATAATTSGSGSATSSSSSSTTTPAQTSSSAATTAPATTSSQYKDGTYTGSSTDAVYGNVQVSATISNGKITNVKFLDYPHTHNTSVMINQQAMPYLQQEALQAQSSNVQIISGATYTSEAFAQSLSTALNQAKA